MNRFTANPCASSKAVNARTLAARNPGCGVCAIEEVISASGPGLPCEAPCQNPRPGHACSTAIPAKNTPTTASTACPSLGVRQHRPGNAMRTPAAQ